MDMNRTSLCYFRVIIMALMSLAFTRQVYASCADRSIGVENKYIIPDSSFTASSYYARSASDVRYVPSNGRLDADIGWGPKKHNDPNDYLQIDLGLPYVVCAVATQGRSTGGEWVTKYKINISLSNTNWTTYQENGADKTFTANTIQNTFVKHIINKPFLKYIRFIPTKYHNFKTMRVGIYGYPEACENLPLGMQSGIIQDGNITASSSQHPAKNARLHYTSGSSWCASTSDSSPYLQIDLGSSHLICAVAIQGNSVADEWVKSYQIKTSTYGTTWTTYQENNDNRTFYGNYDRSTVVRQVLYHGIVTRYLRIVPKTYQTSTPCLRTEIYGYEFQSTCSSHSVGIPSSSLVPDHRFTATSVYKNSGNYQPYKGRLGIYGAWAPNGNKANDYLQIDLGDMFYICAVSTQGSGLNHNEYVKTYKLLYSSNNKTWPTYSENGQEKVFQGNSDRDTVVTSKISNPFKAKFVRVLPTDYYAYKSIRVDFKGLETGCTSSLGLENSQIQDSQMTSSSSSGNSHSAPRGRLYGSSSWCSSTTSNTEYIQVDLGQVKTVTGIATQGDNSLNKWVTSYKVSYSFDNRYWNEYTEGQVTKVLNGNSNKNGVIVNWLSRPIAGRYVKVLPQTGNGQHCLRFDLYGCAFFAVPKVTVDTADFNLPKTTLTCSVLGLPTPDIQWFNNGTKINATQSTLQVQFIPAEDVITNCTRQDPNTRAVVCNTFYTCRATYPKNVPSAGIAEGIATVSLNVPDAPVVTIADINKRSALLQWTPLNPSDDVGTITWYTIELYNQSTTMTHRVKNSSSSYTLTYLKPYTNYTLRMNAISIVGTGLWSSKKWFRTSIAEPDGIPDVKGIIATSSTSITIEIKYTKLDLLHGPMAGFKIFYKPEGGVQQCINVGNVTMATLNALKKYTNYSIAVSVRNTKYAGPKSSITTKATLEDVPDIGPQNAQYKKINDTSFHITWKPLTKEESNGVVSKYEINWSSLSRHRSRRSIQEMFTATTSGTSFTIHGLRPCSHYTVYIRGYTSIGPGPNSTVSFSTSQPGEPTNVQAGSQTGTSIEVSWEKPLLKSKDVIKYTIEVKGSKTYWPQYTFSKNYTQDGGQTSKVINDLLPGTSYQIWVMATTECGQSQRSDLIKKDTNISNPDKPVGVPVTLKDNFTVPLWLVNPKNGPISSYQVIVFNGNQKNVDELLKTDKENNEFNIIAELMADNFKSIFTVGDDKKYGDYHNAPLDTGKTYTIAERAITKYNQETYEGKAAVVATIEVTHTQDGKKSSLIGPAVGGVVAVLFIVAIIVLVVIIFLKRRPKPKSSRKESRIPLDEIEDGEIGNVNDGEEVEVGPNNVAIAVPASLNQPARDIYDEVLSDSDKPIRVQQFPEYVRSMKATGYARLKEEYKKLPTDNSLPRSVAKKPVNKRKNRYGNAVPYDHSRVVIERTAGDEDSDYVNASFIKGYDGSPKKYIASQGPVEESFADFWQMIWEQKTRSIVMLTNLRELGKTKCHQYWPESMETYRDITVNKHKTEVYPDYIIQTFLLTKTNSEEKRHILHFHFTVWPDKGVPHYATAVLGLRRKVKALNPQNSGPIVIHCSAGVGRTGTYIVIDAMLERAKKLRTVEIKNYISMIRNDRTTMVQTDEQYVFIHLAILEELSCGNTEIEASNLQLMMNRLTKMDPKKKASGYAVEYERLNSVTADYAEDETDIGRSKENEAKNRYPDVIAPNHSRVKLMTARTTDYINASFVDAYRERNAFIVTQAPLQNTIEDFWLMVVNYEIGTIVMLNTLQEIIEEFPQYWPHEGSETYGDVTVELLEIQSMGEIVVRKLQVSYKSTRIHVQHLQHVEWPNKGIPAKPQSVLNLLNEMQQSQRQANNSPVVVQCSNGIGRSGTFCAISSILERMKQEQVIDVFQVVKCIRANRPGTVESLIQYVFCYQIIQKYLDSFSDYANFSNC